MQDRGGGALESGDYEGLGSYVYVWADSKSKDDEEVVREDPEGRTAQLACH